MEMFFAGFGVSFMFAIFGVVGLISMQNELNKSRELNQKMGNCLTSIEETITRAENWDPEVNVEFLSPTSRDLFNYNTVKPEKAIWIIRKQLEKLERDIEKEATNEKSNR